MIFNSNTTSLGSSIPMAEGYDCSCGVAQALIESARNDYQMFRAMLDIDARELQIKRESSGVMRESQITVLKEATLSGIWEKIKELFSKLVAKIKAIIHTFMSKINGLVMDNKKLVKKYENEVSRKSNLGKMEVKWVGYGTGNKMPNGAASINTLKTLVNDSVDTTKKLDDIDKDWDADVDNRHKKFIKNTSISYDDFNDDMDNAYRHEDTVELKEVSSGRDLCNTLSGWDKMLKAYNDGMKPTIKAAEDNIKEADKNAKKIDADTEETKVTELNHKYEMCVAYQDVLLKAVGYVTNAWKDMFKVYKSAFMKAIAANDEKLAESTYLDAVAEAAEQEVDDVIDSALSKEELSKINNASLNVMDADVSDDADKLTYGPDKYTDDIVSVRTAGTVDTDINSKEESAFFGKLFY